jgi:hypothetical protein
VDIYEKRGSWCFRDAAGKLHKFNTEEEALVAAGLETPIEETLYGEEEEEGEETSTYE